MACVDHQPLLVLAHTRPLYSNFTASTDLTSRSNWGVSVLQGAVPGWTVFLQPNGAWGFNCGDGHRRLDYLPPADTHGISDGAWHLIAFTLDTLRGEVRLYHNHQPPYVASLGGIWEPPSTVEWRLARRDAVGMRQACTLETLELHANHVPDNPARRRDNYRRWCGGSLMIQMPRGGSRLRVEASRLDGVMTLDEIRSCVALRRSELGENVVSPCVPPPPLIPGSVPAVCVVRILTWNIWHGGRHSLLDDWRNEEQHGDDGEEGVMRVVARVLDSGADVVCFQETYGSGPLIAARLGWHFYSRGSNLSVASRWPIIETHDIFQPFRLGGVTLQLGPNQRLTVFTLWLHWLPVYADLAFSNTTVGRGPTERCDRLEPHDILFKQTQLVAEELETRGTELAGILALIMQLRASRPPSSLGPIVVAGDFNSPSHLDWGPDTADLRHAGLCVSWPTSVAMHHAGYADCFRAARPNCVLDQGFTWSPRYLLDFADRIDYIYALRGSAVPLDATVMGWDDPEWPSDHAAVVADVGLFLTSDE
eukprot:gnl/Spiro4/22254_TR10950_c0_g1_i1.p1 gnl/Spiro4/22254_TR10950_c0_g1~~gnl/Spiro4/22254_TR10950_c0_g1_i1.p1  ORF type:complete len:577 (+),score=76.16 gnl/Spiro4/22254_TR10950_c0_g1_i1:125-1732(+)